jgi:tRNA(Ile)-lysidine synthase
VPKARLEATLLARSLPWVEDPSNQDPAYARSRLRRLRPELDALGLTAPCLAATAGQLGYARAARERRVASVLARAAALDVAGYAWLDPAPLLSADADIGERALARVLLAVGGGGYAPRLERLRRLYGRLAKGLGRGATLGGCRILPRRNRLLIVREPAAAPSVPVRPGEKLRWDSRFDIAVSRRAGRAAGALVLAPLGEAGWDALSRASGGARSGIVPAAAGAGLPALSDRRGLLSVPHLGYGRGPEAGPALIKCTFAPENPLAGPRFTVA